MLIGVDTEHMIYRSVAVEASEGVGSSVADGQL